MAKPKHNSEPGAPRPARPNFTSAPRTAKPHRKGPRPDAAAPAEPRKRYIDQLPEFNDVAERRVKKRWENEPPAIKAMKESIRDAAIKAAGHPPIAKPPKPVAEKPAVTKPAKPSGGFARAFPPDDERPAAPIVAKPQPAMPPPARVAPDAVEVAPRTTKLRGTRGSGKGATAPETEIEPVVEAAPIVAPEPIAPNAAPTVVKPVRAKAAPKTVAPAPVAEVAPAVEEPAAPVYTGPTFDDLGLSPEVRAAVAKAGYETPTPIQAGAIPVLLQGHDLIGQAQTGTGKTAAFALPAIQLIDPSSWNTQAIVLAPTRELAIQVAAEIQAFASATGVRVTAVYGGQPIDRQFRALKNGAQIVVGTPGRVLDHMRRETLSLANVKLCVLDEADEMLALGFAEEVEGILSELPPVRQTALFSATMQDRVLHLSKKYLRNPQHVQIETKRRTVDTTKQTYYDVVPGKKKDALARVLDMESPGPTIVFCRTRMETEELAEALRIRGYAAESLNGDMGQTERERVLRRFRDGQADILVATDVAARGLDIDTVTHVINYDIPWDVEQYIHRIGRTGRAGRTGDAITLVEPRQRRQLYFIEQQIGVKMTPARVPTAADISARRRQRFVEALQETLETGDFAAYLDIVGDLSDTHDPSDVAAAALKMLWKSWSTTPEEIDTAVGVQEDRTESGMVRVFIGAGRFEGLRPGDIVGAITRELGLSGRSIGAIDILDKMAFVEVPAAEANAVCDVLGNTRFRGRKIDVHVARDRRG